MTFCIVINKGYSIKHNLILRRLKGYVGLYNLKQMESRKDIRRCSGVGRVRDEPFCGKSFLQIKILLDVFFITLSTYDKIVAVWKKVVQGVTPGSTCYLSRNTVLKKLRDLYTRC